MKYCSSNRAQGPAHEKEQHTSTTRTRRLSRFAILPLAAGLAIGLTLTLIHLISIPISNTSVNPARSTAVAFFNGDGAPAQLWAFWLAPLVGAAIAGIAYPLLFGRAEELADRPVRDDALEEVN